MINPMLKVEIYQQARDENKHGNNARSGNPLCVDITKGVPVSEPPSQP